MAVDQPFPRGTFKIELGPGNDMPALAGLDARS
jgi:hypothetical protein